MGANDAANLTTGELADARLSANVPLLDAANTFTDNPTVSNTQPTFTWTETDGSVSWRVVVAAGLWQLQRTDGGIAEAIQITGDGAGTITALELNGTAVTKNGSEILTEADEGTGNGLDADTVDGIEGAALRDATINTQNVSYTLVLGDAGKTIYKASGGAGETITVPANASVAFPTGTMVTIVNQGGGTLSIAITTDTMTLAGTGSTGTRTLADDGVATLLKVTSTSWIISGTGLS